MNDARQRWIGVDFDGTLANFECAWPEDYRCTGTPIPAMVERVKQWIKAGEDVRIFTARMDCYHPSRRLLESEVREPIERWCLENLGVILPITNVKDHYCKALYLSLIHI